MNTPESKPSPGNLLVGYARELADELTPQESREMLQAMKVAHKKLRSPAALVSKGRVNNIAALNGIHTTTSTNTATYTMTADFDRIKTAMESLSAAVRSTGISMRELSEKDKRDRLAQEAKKHNAHQRIANVMRGKVNKDVGTILGNMTEV